MRDDQIYALDHKQGRRFGLLLAQFEYLKTRQEATEAVFLVASLRQRIAFVLWPETFLAAVDAVQRDLIDTAQKELAEAKAKAKIQRVDAGTPLPKGVVIGG